MNPTKVFNILVWTEFAKIDLFPVQKFVLKMLHGLPLDDNYPGITLWNPLIPMESAGLTETQYLKYLYLAGRCNVINPSPTPYRKFVGVFGRRSGKSFLGNLNISWEKELLEDEIQKGNIPASNPKALPQVIMCDVGKPYALSASDVVEQFRAPQESDRARLSPIGCNSRAHNGGPSSYLSFMNLAQYVDNAGHDSSKAAVNRLSPLTQLQSEFPGQPVGKIATWSSPREKTGALYAMYQQSFTDPSTLMLQIPTWELNPNVPNPFYLAQFERDPNTFRAEYGAQFLG